MLFVRLCFKVPQKNHQRQGMQLWIPGPVLGSTPNCRRATVAHRPPPGKVVFVKVKNQPFLQWKWINEHLRECSDGSVTFFAGNIGGPSFYILWFDVRPTNMWREIFLPMDSSALSWKRQTCCIHLTICWSKKSKHMWNFPSLDNSSSPCLDPLPVQTGGVSLVQQLLVGADQRSGLNNWKTILCRDGQFI